MEVVTVVRRLIGPINPIGETNTDAERLENLKEMTALIDALLRHIAALQRFKDCAEYSMKQAGKHAEDFIKYIREEYHP